MSRTAARWAWILLLAPLCLVAFASAESRKPGDPANLLRELDQYPHSVQVDHVEKQVVDHEIGLGAIQKYRGAWNFDESERLSGELTSYTWQIVDGFTSIEVMQELLDLVAEELDSSLLYKCEGRACGHPAQWANRVFGQRVLYGRQDWQRYQVFKLEGEPAYRLVVYAAARTSDRQYLHVALLRVEQTGAEEI
ncbi:MAG: DUF4892 domain-containing protein [Halioglobus sp.]|nr:DUF4892 domain-containing protein [Halioglobus sp.]